MNALRCATVLSLAAVLLGYHATGETCVLPEATLEKGGTTFDFEAISAKRFAGIFDPAKNILKEKVAEHLTAPSAPTTCL